MKARRKWLHRTIVACLFAAGLFSPGFAATTAQISVNNTVVSRDSIDVIYSWSLRPAVTITDSGDLTLTGDNKVRTTQWQSTALNVATGGNLLVSGDIGVTTSSSEAHGVVVDAGTASFMGKTSVETANQWSAHGVVVRNDGTVTFGADSETTLMAQGSGSHGLYISDGGHVIAGGSLDVETTSAEWGAHGISVENGALTLEERSETSVATAGQGARGLNASAGGAIVSDGNLAVETKHDATDWSGAYAIAADGGTVTFGENSNTVVTTANSDAYGLYAGNNGTITARGGMDITTDGLYTSAVYAESGTITFEEGSKTTLTTMSRDAHGLNAQGGEIVGGGGMAIVTNADGSHGVAAEDGGAVTLSAGSVTTVETDGYRAHGFYASSRDAASGGSIVSRGSVDLTLAGEESSGFFVLEGKIDHDGELSVVTDNVKSHGVYAGGDNAAIVISGDTNIETNGGESNGFMALNGANIDVSGTAAIVAKAAGSAGVSALEGGTFHADSGSSLAVVTKAADSAGVSAANGMIVLDGTTQVTTEGGASHGLFAGNGAGIRAASASVETFGDAAHGAYASASSSIDITGSVTTSGAGSHGLVSSGGSAVNLRDGAIQTASNDSSWLMYADSDGTINLGSVAADASGSLNLLRTDSGGTVNAGSASRLEGDVTHSGLNAGALDVNLSGGTKFIGAANELGGNADARISITLDATSDDCGATDYWQVTKDSNMQGDLTNRGVVDFVHATSADFNALGAHIADDSAYKKITVQNFTGTTASGDMAGRLVMKADVGADKGDSIYGAGKATGHNVVDLQLMGYAGKERMDQALVYMEDGANSDAAFTLLDNAVTAGGVADAGAWNYILEEGMDGAAKEWYLKRNGLTSTGQGLVNGAVTPEMWYTEVATLYDRMGDYKNPQYKGGIWASASYRKVEFDGEGGAFGMLPFDVKMKTLTVGYDQKNNHSNGTWYHGIMLGYGQEERDSGIGDADTDSMHATLYTVYKKPGGFYLSALAKYNHYDTDLTVNRVDRLTQQLGYDQVTGGLNQRGLGVSMMTGKRFNMGDQGWYWEPQMQLSYMRIFGGKYITNSGLDVDIEATTSVRARAGFLFGKAFQLNNGHQLDLFADLSYNKEFDGETDIWLSGGKYTRDLGDAWGSYGLGFSWKMGERSYLGGRIAYGSGSDRTEPISATLGLLFETN